MEGVIGYTTGFAGNFAPKNWAFCAGQIMTIASNTALFSILGTVYGGNGTTTFGLPDLQGRAVVGVGTGPGLSTYSLGQKGGSESTTLNALQMPAHVHPVTVTISPEASDTGSAPAPDGNLFATPSNGNSPFAGSSNTTLPAFTGALTMAPVGGSQPFSNVHPLVAINYIICLYGVYPARN